LDFGSKTDSCRLRWLQIRGSICDHRRMGNKKSFLTDRCRAVAALRISAHRPAHRRDVLCRSRGRRIAVFAHVNDELRAEVGRIERTSCGSFARIRVAGFDVAHVIHRHGLKRGSGGGSRSRVDRRLPRRHERSGGEESDERGVDGIPRTVIEQYEAPEAAISTRPVSESVNRYYHVEQMPLLRCVRRGAVCGKKLTPVRAATSRIVPGPIKGA